MNPRGQRTPSFVVANGAVSFERDPGWARVSFVGRWRRMVVSAAIDAPAGGVYSLRVRPRGPGLGDCPWFTILGRDPESSSGPGCAGARLEVDVLLVPSGATGLEVSFEVPPGPGPTPRLIGCWWAAWRGEAPSEPGAWGTRRPRPHVVDVPWRSQLVETDVPPRRICLPTCLAMVLEMNGLPRPTAEVARRVHDDRHGIFGNWPLACQAAATYGLAGRVVAAGSLRALLPWLERGIPPVVSLSFGAGELPGAPLPSTAGHLVVVRGVGAGGEVLCCDPAAVDERSGVVAYPAEAFARAWKGVALVIGPRRLVCA